MSVVVLALESASDQAVPQEATAGVTTSSVRRHGGVIICGLRMQNLDGAQLAILATVFFLTGIFGVITGGNSLITVPAMLAVGVDARLAIATNMVAITFLSVGGAIPLAGAGALDTGRLPRLAVLTVISSAVGALLLAVIPSRSFPWLIACFMFAVCAFVLLDRRCEHAAQEEPTWVRERFGDVATTVLGAYGGLFSGGYVTILTAAFRGFYRHSFKRAVATTKVVNVFSSAAACCIFAGERLIAWPLAGVLSVAMFGGGYLGGQMATRLSEVWIRRIFLVTVLLLAFKTMVAAAFRV